MKRLRSGGLPTLATAGLIALGTMLMACGNDDDGQSSDVPDGAAAIVGDAQISQAALDERITALSRALRQPATQDTAQRKLARQQLQQQALSLLVIAEATEQEAAERGIRVSQAEARQRWRDVARDQFATRKELRRFLGGQTERDIVDQLRMQMLTEQINAQVAAEAGGGKQGERAVRRFQREFTERWQDRTACREDLDASGCPAPTDAE